MGCWVVFIFPCLLINYRNCEAFQISSQGAAGSRHWQTRLCDWSPFTTLIIPSSPHLTIQHHSDLIPFSNPSIYILQMLILRNQRYFVTKSSSFVRSSIIYTRKMSTPAATIKSLDHLVLTVKSIPKTSAWYEKNLGMKRESFVSATTLDITRHSLIFGSQKINLHELGKVPPPSLPLFPLPQFPPCFPFNH